MSWRTATAYDATIVLIKALEKKSSPSRDSVRQVLADDNFQAEGSTGAISFRGGDRNEFVSTLVKVVPSQCSPYNFMFVPEKYSAAQLKDLDRDCK